MLKDFKSLKLHEFYGACFSIVKATSLIMTLFLPLFNFLHKKVISVIISLGFKNSGLIL